MLAVFKNYVQVVKKEGFYQIWHFQSNHRLWSNYRNFSVQEILTNGKHLVQLIVSVVIKVEILFKITPTRLD